MGRRAAMNVFLLALVCAACTRVSVSTDYDHTANFGALHTYAWRPGKQQGMADPRYDSSLIDRRVRAAVERVLASKGYTPAAAGTPPDFLVGYHVVVRQKTSVQTIDHYYGYRVGGWGGWPQTYSHDYDEGTLLIDIIDPQTMKLLWRGSGTAVVDPTASAEKRERRINDAVDDILDEFPPHQ